LKDLPEGAYDVAAAKEGFQDETVRGLKVGKASKPFRPSLKPGTSQLLLQQPMPTVIASDLQPTPKLDSAQKRYVNVFRYNQKALDAGQIRRETFGSSKDERFEQTAHDGGLLIGFSGTIGRFAGNAPTIQSLTPMFLSPAGRRTGESAGADSTGEKFETSAKPGYAVGGVITKTGLNVDGFQVVYCRIAGPGALNSQDAYTSEWIGGTGGGKPKAVGIAGKPVIGVHGWYTKKFIARLGLVQIP
jgi:hypothetical protein